MADITLDKRRERFCHMGEEPPRDEVMEYEKGFV